MSHRLMLGLLVAALGCGGSAAPAAPGTDDRATTPEAAVRNFMQAVADSNIARMARYWGTSRGPAAITRQPADFEERMVVTQAYLRQSPFRLVRTDELPNQPDRRAIQVEFSRVDYDGSRCTRGAPFTVVETGSHGWIVVAVDLNQVGTPGRSCAAAAKTTP